MSGVHVIKNNFSEYYPIIKSKIDQAAFISIDSEFTGLNVNEHTRSSLFDTAEERYKKARENVKSFTIAQFGITAFVSVGTNSYDAYTYNVYLFPAPVGSYDERFSMQASSLQFLCQYGFDFNKMIYEGVPYLNRSQEVNVREYWKSNIGCSMDLSTTHRVLLRKYCSAIARWIVQAKDGDKFTLEKTSDEGEMPNELIHRKLIHIMENIWPLPSTDNVLVVEKVSTERKEELKKAQGHDSTDCEKYVEQSVGFSNVIKHLIKSQKIIVGHNLYLDLMLIYDKFIDPLPHAYESYKTSLHQYLPNIYDTKCMSLRLRRKFEGTAYEYDSTNLSELYLSMIEPQKRSGILFAPSVYIKNTTIPSTESGDTKAEESGMQIHEAGYDSYMCGYVFLRLAHLVTITNSDAALASHPIPFYDYNTYLTSFKNSVNLIRARLHNIRLDGPDAACSRLNQLFVKTKGYSTQLNINEVSTLFSSFGAVDINRLGQNKAVAVVGNVVCADRILCAFKTHEKFTVVKYSVWRHSPLASKFIWTGAVLTAGICTIALIKNARKPTFPSAV